VLDDYRTGSEQYLDLIQEAKKSLSIPVIPSLNGTSVGGWIEHAKKMQDAGADALELNIYFVAGNIDDSAEDVERRYLELVQAVRKSISIPMAVKIGPYFSSPGNMCKRLADAGADGLVLFNRFLQPDIDLDAMETAPHLELSSPAEMLLPLRWIAILHGQIDASLAVTSGVHDWSGMVKSLLAGADVTQIASTIYLNGFAQLEKMIGGLTDWLERNNYGSVAEMRGSMSQQKCPDPAAFERGNYMKALTSFTGQPV
jgi:dihydroorotate dehydrogenase (fumarate)